MPHKGRNAVLKPYKKALLAHLQTSMREVMSVDEFEKMKFRLDHIVGELEFIEQQYDDEGAQYRDYDKQCHVCGYD